MDRDLFLAILAMDAYHRGYDAGVSGLNETGPSGAAIQLGNATLRPATTAEKAG